jgi:flagellin
VTVPPVTVNDFTHVVQSAPNHTDEYTISIGPLNSGIMASTGANTLGTLTFATQADAGAAIGTLDALIALVSAERSGLGAHMSALDVELNIAIDSAVTATTAEARITDADVAVEATALMQAQLAQDVQNSVLQALHAQSNASLELMVSMLGSSPLQAPNA